jgi:hypothetical protein
MPWNRRKRRFKAKGKGTIAIDIKKGRRFSSINVYLTIHYGTTDCSD